MTEQRHLAELNIARLKYPTSDPRLADFMNNLDRINGLAEAMDGFVWRLKDDSGNATDIKPFDDPNVIANMSVWRDAESLERFVWQTVHKRFYQRKHEWFDALESHHLVMWWVPAGHQPDLDEAIARLALLDEKGPSEDAFGWESLASAELWKDQRCA